MNGIKNTKKGFTLLELLLYVSLSAMILLASSIFISFLLQSRVKNQSVAEVEQQGLQVMQVITQAVRNGDIILSPATSTSASTLSINTYTVGLNPTVFSLSTSTINVSEAGRTPIALTNSKVVASNLIFSNLSRANTPGTVRIQFTLTSLNNDGRSEFSFSKSFIGTASIRYP